MDIRIHSIVRDPSRRSAFKMTYCECDWTSPADEIASVPEGGLLEVSFARSDLEQISEACYSVTGNSRAERAEKLAEEVAEAAKQERAAWFRRFDKLIEALTSLSNHV